MPSQGALGGRVPLGVCPPWAQPPTPVFVVRPPPNIVDLPPSHGPQVGQKSALPSAGWGVPLLEWVVLIKGMSRFPEKVGASLGRRPSCRLITPRLPQRPLSTPPKDALGRRDGGLCHESSSLLILTFVQLV